MKILAKWISAVGLFFAFTFGGIIQIAGSGIALLPKNMNYI
jgi:hypothetical protein